MPEVLAKLGWNERYFGNEISSRNRMDQQEEITQLSLLETNIAPSAEAHMVFPDIIVVDRTVADLKGFRLRKSVFRMSDSRFRLYRRNEALLCYHRQFRSTHSFDTSFNGNGDLDINSFFRQSQ